MFHCIQQNKNKIFLGLLHINGASPSSVAVFNQFIVFLFVIITLINYLLNLNIHIVNLHFFLLSILVIFYVCKKSHMQK